MSVTSTLRLAIMQPYLLPYIGYFQLIANADMFVIYDNIEYTKKGWINRNRILQNGDATTFTIPLQKDSDFLDVRERYISQVFNREKLLNQITGAYRRAPYFDDALPLLQRTVRFEEENLFGFLKNSLTEILDHLEIQARVVVSSDVPIDHDLRGQDKVLALCRQLGASSYVNTWGGMDLYSRDTFRDNGVDLQFIRPKQFEYPQFGQPFIPWLSIIDVLMFNPIDQIRSVITSRFELG